jgi:hypothetical protein
LFNNHSFDTIPIYNCLISSNFFPFYSCPLIYMRLISFLFILFYSFHFSFSTAQKIEILVLDKEKNPLVAALVTIKNIADSEEENHFTESNGKVILNQIASGKYPIEISYLGFETLQIPLPLINRLKISGLFSRLLGKLSKKSKL